MNSPGVFERSQSASWAFFPGEDKLLPCVSWKLGEQKPWLDRASPLAADKQSSHGVCELGKWGCVIPELCALLARLFYAPWFIFIFLSHNFYWSFLWEYQFVTREPEEGILIVDSAPASKQRWGLVSWVLVSQPLGRRDVYIGQISNFSFQT